MDNNGIQYFLSNMIRNTNFSKLKLSYTIINNNVKKM